MAGIQLGGLASGLDTETLITQLMQVERQPKVRLQRQELVEEARKTALSDIRTRLQSLATSIATLSDASTWGDVQTIESSDPAKVAVARTGGAAAGGTTIRVDRLASADQVTQQNGAFATATSADKLTIGVGAKSITVNIAAGDDVAAIASKINGSSNTPVYASVLSGKLVLSGKTTGDDATIAVSDGDGANGYDLATDLFGPGPLAHKNLDARVSVDGGATWLERPSNTVDDLIAGVTVSLKGTTTSDVTVMVGEARPDAAAVKAKLQAFVEQYNSTVSFVRDELVEKKVTKPETSADLQKGVLAGDAGLSGLLSRLRQAVGDAFTGNPVFANLSEVGLSTGKATGSGALNVSAVEGKLSLDATKLAEKLEADLSSVKQLFTNPASLYGSQGVAQRLDALVAPWLKGNGTDAAILDSRITSSDSILDALKDRGTSLDVRLATREKSLRMQFTALESALSRTQSQGSFLGAQLAAL